MEFVGFTNNPQKLGNNSTVEILGESLCIQVISIYTLHQLQVGETLSLVTWLQILQNHMICLRFVVQAMNLGEFLFQLLSEALSLNPNHLNDMDCSKGLRMLCHYYPPCPEPDLTIGASKHSDSSFLTVLLPDQIEGLQVLCDGFWFDVPPVPGALIINVGDLLQWVFGGSAYNKRQVHQFGA